MKKEQLVADLSSEPLRTQGVAGSIPTRGTEICAFFCTTFPFGEELGKHDTPKNYRGSLVHQLHQGLDLEVVHWLQPEGLTDMWSNSTSTQTRKQSCCLKIQPLSDSKERLVVPVSFRTYNYPLKFKISPQSCWPILFASNRVLTASTKIQLSIPYI